MPMRPSEPSYAADLCYRRVEQLRFQGHYCAKKLRNARTIWVAPTDGHQESALVYFHGLTQTVGYPTALVHLADGGRVNAK